MAEWKGNLRKEENLSTGESWIGKGFCYDRYRFSKKEWLRYTVEGTVLLWMISWLFYRSFLLSMLSMALLPVYVKYQKRKLINKQKGRLGQEFKEGIRSLAGALRAGYSIENAWREALHEMEVFLGEDTLIVREFRYIAKGLELNMPLEQLLEEFGERSGVEDIMSFTIVFRTAKRTGGNFIGMMEQTARNIAEKQEVIQEIEAILAAKKLEHKVMSLVPFGIIMYTQISFPGFADALYGNLTGIIVMTVCLGIYGAAFYLGEWITEVEI